MSCVFVCVNVLLYRLPEKIHAKWRHTEEDSDDSFRGRAVVRWPLSAACHSSVMYCTLPVTLVYVTIDTLYPTVTSTWTDSVAIFVV